MVRPVEQFQEWQDLTIDNFEGGMVLDSDSELLENNQALRTDNLVLRDRILRKDTGYVPIVSDPSHAFSRRHITFKTPDGVLIEILITNNTLYRNVNNQWRAVSGGVTTTLTGNHAGGATNLTVVSITGFNNGDTIGIVLDSGQMQYVIVNGVPAGSNIPITPALTSAAASGNAVVRLAYLVGIDSKHITAVAIPWADWLVFTNGVDPLKRYDVSSNDVVTVPNLPGGGNMICQTVALYDNSIVAANVTEGGTNFPNRYRYCAKGDGTNWTTLEAGFVDLLERESPILQLLNLGPFLIAYRDKSINRIAISASLLRRFDNDTAVNGVGVFSTYAAVDLVDRHLVWGNNGIYWYSGGFGVEQIDNPITDILFGPNGEFPEDTRSKAFTLYLKKSREVLFLYQKSGDSTVLKAVSWHTKYPTAWSVRNFALRIGGFGSRISGSSLDWSQLQGEWSNQLGDWSSYNTSGNIEQEVLCVNTRSVVYNHSALLDDYGGSQTNSTSVLETKDFAHENFLLVHDYLDIFAKGGTIIVEYSTDKGASWNAMGTVAAGSITQRFRLHRQFTSRHFRYRFTATDPVSYVALHTRYKLAFEW